jgi:hypothetical protein
MPLTAIRGKTEARLGLAYRGAHEQPDGKEEAVAL